MNREELRPYEREPRGHVWMTHEDSDPEYSKGQQTVDIFAYTAAVYCNGPRCKNCGYGFCHHCYILPPGACTK